MIRLNLQMFGGRGSGSGGGGGGGAGGGGSKGSGHGSTGSGHGSAGGSGTGQGGQTRQQKTGPVTRLSRDEQYDLYKIKDGRETIYDRDSSYEDTKEILRGYQPDANGIWKDRHGRSYRVVRSRR